MRSPGASLDCQVTARQVDAVVTCGGTACAVTRALDLACATELFDPSLAATAEGAIVLTKSALPPEGLSTERLLTVTADGSRVEDVPELGEPDSSWHSYPAVASTQGTSWVFGVGPSAVSVRRGTDAGWSSNVMSELVQGDAAYITGARLVDDEHGYVTFSKGRDELPHLLTWDGTCWSDELLDETRAYDTAIAIDALGKPWSIVLVAAPEGANAIPRAMGLRLRAPDEDSRTLWLDTSIWSASPTNVSQGSSPIHLVPGGPDGSAPAPLMAARFDDGIRVYEAGAADPTDWPSVLMPESALPWKRSGDCDELSGFPSERSGEDPCMGRATCELDNGGSGSGFDMVRTESGETFVVWLNYVTTSTNITNKQCRGGELPGCSCEKFEMTSAGTAELIVAHLTETGPELNHFQFDLGGANVDPSHGVALDARGDTLLVAAQLDGGPVRKLTYVELDSRRLR